jgi:hypothetical protein
MKTRTLSALAAASLLAAGCAQLRGDEKTAATPPPNPNIKCEVGHPVCHITVRVTGCKVSVEPDWKRVAMRPGGVTVLWTIRDSPGVVFARNGITFKMRAEAREVFRVEDRTLVSSTVAMHNNTAVAGKFPYTVHVVDNGKRCEPHDPGIINEM